MPPTYYVLDKLSGKFGLPAPSVAAFFQALRDGGFKAVATHFNPEEFELTLQLQPCKIYSGKMTVQTEPACSDKSLRAKTASSKKHTNGELLMADKIAVIGAGMMGGAIVKSLLKSKYAGKVIAADFMTDKLKELEALGAAVTSDNKKAAAEADIVFVAVKPGDLEKVLKGISKEVKGKLVVSTAATVPVVVYQEERSRSQSRSDHA